MSTKQSPLALTIQVTSRTNAQLPKNAKGKRRYAPKSRGGCATCRDRHIRCDQRRPRCSACQKSSRQCDFSVEQNAIRQGKLRVVLWEPTGSNLALKEPSPIPGQSPAEARALDYFRDIVAPRLAGTYDPTFWNRVVLQASHRVSSLRHAIVALASHWENVVVPGSRIRSTTEWDCDTYALQQYTKAITEMRMSLQHDPKPSREELLVSNLLFFCIEMFQNHFDSALRQMSSGIHLFCDWSESNGTKKDSKTGLQYGEFARLIGHIFRRLIVQSMLFPIKTIGNEPIFLPKYAPMVLEMPENFETMDQARDYFNFCITTIFYQSRMAAMKLTLEQSSMENHMELYEPFKESVRYFEQWRKAFKKFQETNALKLTGESARYCIVMDIHQLATQIIIPSHSFKTQLEYDRYTSFFEKIIDRVSYLIDTKAQEKIHHYPKFDIGLIPSMFLTALRCRHPRIRRKAIALLRRGPRQEGVWNSDMIACVAERVLEIEEIGLTEPKSCEDIPLSSRIKIVEASMHTSTCHVALVIERQIETECYQDKLMYEMIPY